MPPSILLWVEHPSVEGLGLHPHLDPALLVRTHSLALGPWGCTDGADLDEVVDLTLGEVIGVRVSLKWHGCSA